jgi:hypothetical protein
MGETDAGVLCLKTYKTAAQANAHPIKLSAWKRVWITKVPDAPERPADTGEPAPLPYQIEISSTPSNNGHYHLYLIDANGRRIAAIWGREKEKMATAERLVDAANRL